MKAEIETEEIEDHVILRINGCFAVLTASLFEKRLRAMVRGKHDEPVLNFTSIDYLSDFGGRLLPCTSRVFPAGKGALDPFPLVDEVMDVSGIVGFEKNFHFFKNKQEALQHTAQM